MTTRPLETPPSGGPQASPGFHLWHASLAWKAEVTRVLAPYSLTSTQFFLLGAIGWSIKTTSRSPTQAEMARFSGLDAMTTSQVVRALESAGLVRRADDPEDTRQWRLSLSTAGRQKLKEASAAVRGADQQFFASVEGREEFVQTLRELRRLSEQR